MGFQEEEERPRPAFAAKAPYLEKNPITGIREPSFPQSKRYKRIAAGMGLIMFMVCSVFLCSRVYLKYSEGLQNGLFNIHGTKWFTVIHSPTTLNKRD